METKDSTVDPQIKGSLIIRLPDAVGIYIHTVCDPEQKPDSGDMDNNYKSDDW